VLLARAGWVVFTQAGARQQISTEHDVAAARKMVAASFGVVWTRVRGRGQKNFRPKLRKHAPRTERAAGTMNPCSLCAALPLRMLLPP
jgi:hypothetical protein